MSTRGDDLAAVVRMRRAVAILGAIPISHPLSEPPQSARGWSGFMPISRIGDFPGRPDFARTEGARRQYPNHSDRLVTVAQ